jgi:hypothetical protein
MWLLVLWLRASNCDEFAVEDARNDEDFKSFLPVKEDKEVFINNPLELILDGKSITRHSPQRDACYSGKCNFAQFHARFAAYQRKCREQMQGKDEYLGTRRKLVLGGEEVDCRQCYNYCQMEKDFERCRLVLYGCNTFVVDELLEQFCLNYRIWIFKEPLFFKQLDLKVSP